MTVWEQYSQKQRSEYIEYLKMYGALSGMFNQKASETGAPYLDSKFQETLYANIFDSKAVDIGNTPHDILSKFNDDKIGIGIKTWLGSKPCYQKVMQVKKYKDDINSLNNEKNKEELAIKIAKIKNDKLNFDYKRLGLSEDKNIYHYVTRDSGEMILTETTYPKVDLKNLTPGELTSSSFKFSDGIKNYKYTFADCQIWMYFDTKLDDTYELAKVPINILSKPFEFLKDSFSKYNKQGDVITYEDTLKGDYLYLPLYSYRSKKVATSSGLNAWNAGPKIKGSTSLRPIGEAYIPIPSKLWSKFPYWVDPKVNMSKYKGYKKETQLNNYKINLHMPDGQIFPAIFAQQGFKSLQTNPQNILGSWILNVLGVDNPQRQTYNKSANNIVTMSMLKKIGIDSVKIWHENPNNLNEVWIDFAEYGSFERFMNGDIQGD